MQKGDLPAVARAIATLVRDHVGAAVEGVTARLTALENRFSALPTPKDGEDGKSVTLADVQPLIDDAVKSAVAQLPPAPDLLPQLRTDLATAVEALPKAKDGESVSLEDVRPVIAEAVKAAVAELPAPKDGTSVTLDEVLPPVLEAMRAAVAELPPPKDGESVTLDQIRPLVEEAVKALPPAEPGKDGESVTVAQVLPDLKAQVKQYLDALPVPQDGKSVTVNEVVQALLPALQTTLDGAMAKWALDFERRAQETLQRACAAIPKPKDGDNGRDALAVDAFAAQIDDDGRTIVLSLGAGEQRKEARLQFPVVLDRGVFKDGADYARGDAVTWAGSLWIAQKDAPEGKPDTSRDWRLSVKRGRDGKDVVRADPKPPGPVKL